MLPQPPRHCRQLRKFLPVGQLQGQVSPRDGVHRPRGRLVGRGQISASVAALTPPVVVVLRCAEIPSRVIAGRSAQGGAFARIWVSYEGACTGGGLERACL